MGRTGGMRPEGAPAREAREAQQAVGNKISQTYYLYPYPNDLALSHAHSAPRYLGQGCGHSCVGVSQDYPRLGRNVLQWRGETGVRSPTLRRARQD